MDQVFNVGVIGLGVVGQRFLSQLIANQSISIVAICDTNTDTLHKTASEYDIVQTYTNYKELVKQEDIDFVYIALPPAYHHDAVLEAARYQKHILCEKPLANSLEEAEEMLKVVTANKLVHAIHFPLVYEKGYATINKMIKNDEFGNIKRISFKMHFHEWPRPWQQTNWISSREQGGFIREISPHYLQIIISLFGNVSKITSSVEYPKDPLKCEEGLIATLELENGVKVKIDGLSGQAESDEINFTIHGEKSSLSLINWRDIKVATTGKEWVDLNLDEINLETSNIVSEFVHCVRHQKAQLVHFDEGLKIQKVLEELIK